MYANLHNLHQNREKKSMCTPQNNLICCTNKDVQEAVDFLTRARGLDAIIKCRAARQITSNIGEHKGDPEPDMRSDSVHLIELDSSGSSVEQNSSLKEPHPYLAAPNAFFDVKLGEQPRVIFNPEGTFEEGFGGIR